RRWKSSRSCATRPPRRWPTTWAASSGTRPSTPSRRGRATGWPSSCTATGCRWRRRRPPSCSPPSRAPRSPGTRARATARRAGGRRVDEGCARLEQAQAAADDREAVDLFDQAKQKFAAALDLDAGNGRAADGITDLYLARCRRALDQGAYDVARGMLVPLREL